MKNNAKKKYTGFQKFLIVFIPVIVLLLIAAIVMSLAFTFLPMGGSSILTTGNLTIVMALGSAVLAIVCIVFTIINAGKDNDGE